MTLAPHVIANERTYSMPKRCAIAICLDGCEPEYLEVAIGEGLMPNLKMMRETGTDRIAHSVIPSFTNPNNLSIATGRPPKVHGICGNYLFDPDTGEEVMMNQQVHARKHRERVKKVDLIARLLTLHPHQQFLLGHS